MKYRIDARDTPNAKRSKNRSLFPLACVHMHTAHHLSYLAIPIISGRLGRFNSRGSSLLGQPTTAMASRAFWLWNAEGYLNLSRFSYSVRHHLITRSEW